MIRRANAIGIHSFDTAFNYGGGKSLELLRSSGVVGEDVHISTKIGLRTGAKISDLTQESLLDCGRATKRLLGRTVDVMFLHNPESYLELVAPSQRDKVFADAAHTMERLCDEHVARAWGIATSTGFYLPTGNPGCLSSGLLDTLETRTHRIRDVQLTTSLLQPWALADAMLRDSGPLVDCRLRGWSLHISSPLARGTAIPLMTSRLQQALGATQLSAAQACLAFVANSSHPARVCVSMTTLEHMAESVAAVTNFDISLSGARRVLSLLDRSSAEPAVDN